MDILIAGGVILNLVVTAILLLRLNSFRKSVHDFKIMYFTDVTDVTGFLKKQKKIQVKAQLMIGDIPVGQPFVMSEQITETVDEKRVSEIVENIAKPLSGLGIKVITKGLL